MTEEIIKIVEAIRKNSNISRPSQVKKGNVGYGTENEDEKYIINKEWRFKNEIISSG
jgi:hypothetical protein